MERRFTGFLIPILIVTMLWLVFFPTDGKDDKAKAPAAVQDALLQDPEVQEQIKKQPPHELDENMDPVNVIFGARLGDACRPASVDRWGQLSRPSGDGGRRL